MFVPAIDWATTIKLGNPADLKKEPGKPFIGSANAFGDQDPKSQRFGHITAVDADGGQVRWKYDTDTPMVAAVTPTAGELLFTGDCNGNFLVFDAASGNVLLKKDMTDGRDEQQKKDVQELAASLHAGWSAICPQVRGP